VRDLLSARSRARGDAGGRLVSSRSYGRRPCPTSDELIDHLPLRVRALSQITIDRIGDDPPLRTRCDEAQRLKSRLDFGRQTDAQLRIILPLLAGARAGGRPADPPPLTLSLGRHLRGGKRRGFDYCCVCATNNPPV